MRKPSLFRFVRELLPVFVVSLVLTMTGCGGGGGGNDTPPPVSVSISPTTASVVVGATQQFTATVTNAGSSSVSWQVNGVAGGNGALGTISTAGLYTAPTVVPTQNPVTVTAVAVADPSKTASATVTIQAKTGVVISPTSTTVAVSTTQQFTAAINGQTSTAVNWQVNGIPNGNTTVGTIDNSGLYTAPAAVPNPARVTVTAVSQADSSQSASADVTVAKFSNASLKGSYVLVMSGVDGRGPFQQGGVFTADGKGYITGGTSDFLQGSTVLLDKPLNGTYSIDSDSGVGTASLTAGIGVFDLTFAVTESNYVYLIESDQYGNASGSMQRQDPEALTTSSTNGTYVFGWSGSVSNGSAISPIAAVGRYAVSGGTISAGLEDVNDGATFKQLTALSGSYTIGSNGRGAGQFTDYGGTTSMIFYVVDKDTVRLFSADPTLPVTGTAERQTGSFSNATFNGGYVLSGAGGSIVSGFRAINSLALFTATGGATTSGTWDEMFADVATLQAPFTGTYSVDGNGRLFSSVDVKGNAPFVSQQVAWFANPQRAFVLFGDSSLVESGVLEQQTGSTFSSGSVDGAYGFSLSGVDYSNPSNNGDPVDTLGALASNGDGALSIAKTTNRPGDISSTTLSGSYTVDTKGRGIASLSDGTNLVFYVVSGAKVHILETDRFMQISGSARKQ